MPSRNFVCPVCGYPQLKEPAYDRGLPSYEICPSCGTEFGYDDAHATESRTDVLASLRQQWVDKGFPWSGVASEPPPNWNPAEQLASAGLPIPRKRSPTGPLLAHAQVPIQARASMPACHTLELYRSESRFVLRRLAGNKAIVSDSIHDSSADAYTRAEREFGITSSAWIRSDAGAEPTDVQALL